MIISIGGVRCRQVSLQCRRQFPPPSLTLVVCTKSERIIHRRIHDKFVVLVNAFLAVVGWSLPGNGYRCPVIVD